MPITVPLERYILLPVLVAGFILSVLNYISDTRMPSSVYLAFGVLQLGVVALQVFRRNLLAATMGLCLTLILTLAALIERAPFKDFDPILTPVVYRSAIISTAYAVLLASTCLYHGLTLRFVPDRDWIWGPPDKAELSFARRTTWLFFIIGTALLAMTVPGALISDVGYGTDEYLSQEGLLHGSGSIALLSAVFLTFFIVTAVRLYGFHSMRFKFAVAAGLVSMTYFRLLRGSRSGAVGMFFTLAFLYYLNSKLKPWKRNMVLGSAAVVVFIFMNALATVRATAHQSSIGDAFSVTLGGSGSTLDHPMSINLLPQSYWHLLHVVDLYNMHVRLNGRTAYDLVLQTFPEGLTKFFGVQRPLNGAWLLANYRLHGGGMFVIAEGYWNLGLVGALIVAGLMALISIRLEHWFRQQAPVMSCSYFAFIGTFGFGIYYGLQPFVKAFEISIGIALLMKFALNFVRRQVTYRERLAMSLSGVSGLHWSNEQLRPAEHGHTRD